MQNVILNYAATKTSMDKNDVYYTQVNIPERNYNYNTINSRHNSFSGRSNNTSNLSRTNRSNYRNSSTRLYYNNFTIIPNPYMYSSYVAHALTAAASSAAVAAATAAAATSAETISTLTHDKLKLVLENSHSTSLASSSAYDDNIINNTLFLATLSSALSSAPTSHFSFNESFVNLSSASAPSSNTLEVGGVNVSVTSASEDWSHFYDLVLSWQGICLITVFCAFIVITIIGNTLVILAVITTRRLKTVTNCFVMSLAVADLLVGIFVMPPAVAVHLIGSWQLGWVLCDIWISLDVLLCTASILSLCAISVDRYLAVTQPLTYSRKRRSKRLALIMILIVWALALAITCPPILGWYEPGRRDLSECRYNQNEGYVIFSAMGSFFIPMAVMIYVYARISCVIASRHDNMTDINVGHNKKFKRYTAADIDNELDPDLSEFDISIGQKKQMAARTLSNQTLAKDLQEIMASDNENGNTTQCHSLLTLQQHQQQQQQQHLATSPSSRNGCYELKRPTSLKRASTASSTITTMTSTTCTGTVTATAGVNMENPWTFTATQQHYQQQQHAHPNKHMRTHSTRHQHYLSTPTPNPLTHSNTLTPDAIVATSGGSNNVSGSSSILRPHTPQLRSHQHQHSHHYPSKSLSNRITSLKKENKTTQTLSIVVGGFIACWLPFFIYYLITPFLAEDQVSRTLAKVLTWLGWFNSAINPFIYAFYSVDFRAAFWRLTCKRFFTSSSKPQFPTNTMSIRR